MSTIWFTADTHFGHRNIIKYCNRPFMNDEEQSNAQSDPRGRWIVSRATVKRHDDAILSAINESAQMNDELWVLGDFCMGKSEEVASYLERIVCKNVYLVWGNHDTRSIGSAFKKTIEQGMIKFNGQKIWLNHYPMRSWDGRFHGSWHLYGHVHNRFTADDNANPWMLTKDVGVDACDYRPISFEQLSAYMKPRIKAFEAEQKKFLSGEKSAQID